MRLIKKITIVCIILLVMSIFTAAEVVALDCPPGKTGVTIVTPPGKVVEICVAPAAIPYIGGPGDVVIPATCPCWTAESLAQLSSCLEPSSPDIWHTDCDSALDGPEFGADLIIYYDQPGVCCLDSWTAFARSTYSDPSYCVLRVLCGPPYCPDREPPCARYNYVSNLSLEEVQACRAILMSSKLWSLCDGS